MDKYKSETSFQKWFYSINISELSEELLGSINKCNRYSKKLDFQTSLKLLLYAVYEELLSFREIDRAFMDARLCKELGLSSLCHSSLSRKMPQINSQVLMEIFSQLVQKIVTQKHQVLNH